MQRKSILFLLSFFVSLIGFGQFQKGTVTANFNIGDIRYINIENKSLQKNNYLSFNPGIGYFIKNNWEIGVGINFSSLHFRDSSHGGYYQNSSTFGAFIYTNYYLGKRKLKPYLTFQTGLNYTEGKYIYNANPLTQFNSRDFYYSIGGGLNWNISPRFSIFAEAAYRNEYPFDPMDTAG